MQGEKSKGLNVGLEVTLKTDFNKNFENFVKKVISEKISSNGLFKQDG